MNQLVQASTDLTKETCRVCARTRGICACSSERWSNARFGPCQSRRFLRVHATSAYPPKLTVKADVADRQSWDLRGHRSVREEPASSAVCKGQAAAFRSDLTERRINAPQEYGQTRGRGL